MRLWRVWLLIPLFLLSSCQLLKRHPPGAKERTRAERLMEEGKNAEALSWYKKALQKNPQDLDTLMGLGKVHQRLGNYEDARSTLNQVITLSPESGHAKEARQLLEQLPVPVDEAIRERYKGLYSLLGEKELRVQKPPQYRKEVSAEAIDFYNRGLAATRQGKWDLAIGYLTKATELDDTFAPTYTVLGVAYMKKGMYDHALNFLREAVQRDPRNVEARFNLALIYEGKGMWELARQQYMDLVPLNVNNPLVHTRLGIVLMELGNGGSARAQWSLASTLDPNFIPARLLLAKSYADVGPAGYVVINQTVEYDPDQHRASISAETTEIPDFTFFDAAVREYRSILHIQPNLAAAHYGLGTTVARAVQFFVPLWYWDNNDHRDPYNGALRPKMSLREMLDIAERHLRKAVQLAPQNATYHVNLAVVYAEEGKIKQAVHHLNLARKLNPRLLAADGILGVLTSYMGAPAKASSLYGRIGHDHPDHIRATEALGFLQPISAQTPQEPVLPGAGPFGSTGGAQAAPPTGGSAAGQGGPGQPLPTTLAVPEG